jgi:hypothetical protein
MAYGGAGPVGGGGSNSTPAIKQVKLEKECELRIEVGIDAPLRLRLLNGTAEIFGTELPPEIWLNFPPRLKFAVTPLSPSFLFFLFNIRFGCVLGSEVKKFDFFFLLDKIHVKVS